MTLLAALRSQGIHLPSACGGKGQCKLCRVRVTSGAWPPGEIETRAFRKDELDGGLRLACQGKLHGDVGIEVPPEVLGIKRFRGQVERIDDLTYDIKRLRINLIEPDSIEFVCGQYVQLTMPRPFKEGGPVYRAYSIASPPREKNAVELMVRLVPGGVCSVWIHKSVAQGQEVTLTGPHGQFGLTGSNKPMIWIAGGSGMSPFWSMLHDTRTRNAARPCTYFFGVVKRRDMFFADELSAMASELPWFKFVPTLSGPDPADNWTGDVGLITEVVGRHVPAGTDAEAYLCGSPGMIDASIKVLRKKGLGDDRIFFDKFA